MCDFKGGNFEENKIKTKRVLQSNKRENIMALLQEYDKYSLTYMLYFF